jgi:hypothetical protein
MLGLTSLLGAPMLASMVAYGHASNDDPPETWAGHQITYGWRKVPFRGRVRTRTDAYVVATVERDGDRLTLRQRACRVDFKPIGGIKVHMDSSRLPVDVFRFRASPGERFAGTSNVSWGREDIDGDGNPGMTVGVDSKVCSGALFVSNDSKTNAVGAFDQSGAGFHGDAEVEIRQTVLGAEGLCLRVVAKDTQERVRGPFSYVPVPPGSTCETLERRGWPIDAEDDE